MTKFYSLTWKLTVRRNSFSSPFKIQTCVKREEVVRELAAVQAAGDPHAAAGGGRRVAVQGGRRLLAAASEGRHGPPPVRHYDPQPAISGRIIRT